MIRKATNPLLMIAIFLSIVLAAPLLGVGSSAGSIAHGLEGDAEIDRFVALAKRFGVRTEDWFVAYFHRPRDVVFDSTDRGRPNGFDKPDEAFSDAFSKFLSEADSNGDGRYDLRDEGFDPEYDAEDLERFDRNKDGILTPNDVAPRPKPALRDRIRRIIEALGHDKQRYVGWPEPRQTPEKRIERRILDLQASEQVQSIDRGKTARAIQAVVEERASLLAPGIARGRKIFEQRCTGCHGPEGRGDGPAAAFVGNTLDGKGALALPRNLARGVFKYQSRDVGRHPTDEDLFATIRRGLPGSAMPASTDLTDPDVWDLVDYIKHLAERAHRARFADEAVPLFLQSYGLSVVEPVPDPPSATPTLVQEGRYAYMLMQCFACHGVSGRGDGIRAIQADTDGRLIQARNYQATRLLKGGSSPSEIYRTIAHGIGGTPMPAHTDDVLLLTNDMSVDFTEAIRIGGGAVDEDSGDDEEEEEEQEEEYEEPKYEFRLVPGISQTEVDRIKAYVSTLPSQQAASTISAADHLRASRMRRWALVHYVRSLMPLAEHDRHSSDTKKDMVEKKATNNTKGTSQ